MTSWKTTTAGVGALIALIGTTLNQLFDGNPATNPDWNLVLPLIFTSLVGIFARDNTVTSAQVQAAKDEKASRLPMWLLLGVLSLGLFAPGCSTTDTAPPSAQTIAFNSLQTTWIAGHSAYQGFCEEVVRGKVSPGDEADIDKAWNQFRQGFRFAVVAAQNDWTKATPESLAKLKEDLITLILSL